MPAPCLLPPHAPAAVLACTAAQLVAPSDVESKFRELEGSNVDDDLAKMKAALGSGKVAGEVSQLSCGPARVVLIDVSIDEQRLFACLCGSYCDGRRQ